MKITYIHHSGFYIEAFGIGILIDYYMDTDNKYVLNNVITDNKPLYILSSHFHGDHFNSDVLEWKSGKNNITYIFSKDILDEGKAGPEDAVYIEKGGSFADENISIKAYGSTDCGVSFYIEAGGLRLFHAGDFNNWHWNEEATAEEVKEFEGAYYKELDDIAKDISEVDVLMFPVDPRLGRDYYKGALEFIEKIRAGLFVPMHFWDKYDAGNAFKDKAMEKCRGFFEINGKGDSIEWK